MEDFYTKIDKLLKILQEVKRFHNKITKKYHFPTKKMTI